MPKKTDAKIKDGVRSELALVAPLLAQNLKISDRIDMAAELKKKIVEGYTPSDDTQQYLSKASIEELAFALPSLHVAKANIEKYEGEIGDCVLAKKWDGMPND